MMEARTSVSMWLLVQLQIAHSLGPCDPLVPEYCALPFPNSFFTAPKEESLTGVQVNISKATTPADIVGQHTSPVQWNTMGELIETSIVCVVVIPCYIYMCRWVFHLPLHFNVLSRPQ